MLELDKLEASADAAPQEQWAMHNKGDQFGLRVHSGYQGFFMVSRPNAACAEEVLATVNFIEAANPLAIKELIALVRRQEKELATERSMLATSEALRARQAWIPASEKLPPRDEYVWASWDGAGNWHHDAKQGLARHIDGMGWQPMHSMGWDWRVTHWMHLPAAPQPAGESGNGND